MDIHPIRTEADYEAALAEIERLFKAAPNTPEGDRLEVLATLVEAYEAQHYSIPTPDPIEAIKYYMESRGLCRRDLEPYLGSRARVAEVLNRNAHCPVDDPSSPYRARDWGRDSHPVISHGRIRAEQGRAADAEKPPLRPGFPRG